LKISSLASLKIDHNIYKIAMSILNIAAD